ncbi:hypothetical protein J3F83DRAFT_88813 [Trichoderma novae-zelandiae]
MSYVCDLNTRQTARWIGLSSLAHAPPMLFSIHHLPSIASPATRELPGIHPCHSLSPPSVTNLGAPFIQACGRLFRPDASCVCEPNKTNAACPSRRPRPFSCPLCHFVCSVCFVFSAARLSVGWLLLLLAPDPATANTANKDKPCLLPLGTATTTTTAPANTPTRLIRRRRPSAASVSSSSLSRRGKQPSRLLERLHPIRQ